VIGKDATGRELALGRAPQRIVSLIPSVTETLFALGLDEAIVGVTVYCVEPRAGVARKTKVGGEKNPKLELIRELAPDLVIANVEENLKTHVDRLREWGIPVWVTYPRTVAEGIGMVRELGELTATRSRAAAIADELEALLAEVHARTAGSPPVPVFYPIWRAPYMTINADTYVHRVGRTGRAGRRGIAYTFVNETQRKDFEDIRRLAKVSFRRERLTLPAGPAHSPANAGSPTAPGRRMAHTRRWPRRPRGQS